MIDARRGAFFPQLQLSLIELDPGTLAELSVAVGGYRAMRWGTRLIGTGQLLARVRYFCMLRTHVPLPDLQRLLEQRHGPCLIASLKGRAGFAIEGGRRPALVRTSRWALRGFRLPTLGQVEPDRIEYVIIERHPRT